MQKDQHPQNRNPPVEIEEKQKTTKLPTEPKMRETTFDLLHELSIRGVLFKSANENVNDPDTPLTAAKKAYSEKYTMRIPFPLENLSHHINKRYVYLYGHGLLFIWDIIDEKEIKINGDLSKFRNKY
jgi:hypothetical protein